MPAMCDIPDGYEKRMRIVRAFKDLLRDASIKDISIQQICAAANIGKTTFYRFFSSKYEIANWYHYMLTVGGMTEIGQTLTWHDAATVMASRVRAEGIFYQRAFEHAALDGLLRYGENLNMDVQLQTMRQNGVAVTPELEYVMRYWARLVYIAVADWASGGFPFSDEELVKRLDLMRPEVLRQAMDKAVA